MSAELQSTELKKNVITNLVAVSPETINTMRKPVLRTLKVFVAAPFTEDGKGQAQAFVNRLTLNGFEVVSSWHNDPEPRTPLGFAPRSFLSEHAARNLKELESADALIIIDSALSTAGGCWVEFGIALARKTKIILMGSLLRDNPYTSLAIYMPTEDDVYYFLGRCIRKPFDTDSNTERTNKDD